MSSTVPTTTRMMEHTKMGLRGKELREKFPGKCFGNTYNTISKLCSSSTVFSVRCLPN